jgi:type IV pilus assembly protein PilN
MIRVNLLPKKVSKRKMGMVQHLVFTAVALAVAVVCIGYFWVSLNGKIAELKKQVRVTKAEVEKLKDVNSEKNKYEASIAKLKSKLDIITTIKAQRYLPVRLFDELTAVLDRDTPVWLTKFSINSGAIQMEGYSLSNKDLARFVTKLEKTPFFEKVDLLYSDKTKKDDREIFRFSINARAQTKGDVVAQTAAE